MAHSFVFITWVVLSTTFLNSTTTSRISSLFVCNSTTCNIICNEFSACYNITIDASISTTLNLTCSAEESCAYLNLMKGASNATYIHCIDTNACKYATFNNTNTQQIVNLECNSGKGLKNQCEGVTLYAPTTTQINVHCGSETSCKDSIFHIENVTRASFILCAYMAAPKAQIYGNNIQQTLNISCAKSACKYVDIYVNSMANNSSKLNLYCDAYHSCFYAQIYCPIQDASCNIQCRDSLSCQYMTVFIPNDAYDLNLMCIKTRETSACDYVTIKCVDTLLSTSLQYTDSDLDALQCRYDRCCPASLNTVCADGVECIVNCMNGDCQHRYIDGSLATSLHVYCGGIDQQSCSNAKIQCPINESECNINCNGDKACLYMKIDASSSSKFTLNCTEPNSCNALELINGPIIEANIECLHFYSCSHAQFNTYNTSLVNVKCVSSRTSACYNTTVNAVHADDIEINCGSGDCVLTDIFGYYSTSISIFCDELYSCTDIGIFTDSADSLSLICDGDLSCIYANVYCPYFNSYGCSVDCLGVDSCDNLTIFVNDEYRRNYLDLHCDAGSCEWLHFVCKPSGFNTTINTGYDENGWQCTNTDSTSCCPYFVINDMNSSITTTTEWKTINTLYHSIALSDWLSQDNPHSDLLSFILSSSIIIIIVIISVFVLLMAIIAVICCRKCTKNEEKNAEEHAQYNAVNKDSTEFDDEIYNGENVEVVRVDIHEEGSELKRVSSNESMYDNNNNDKCNTTTTVGNDDADKNKKEKREDRESVMDGVSFVEDTLQRQSEPKRNVPLVITANNLDQDQKLYLIEYSTTDLLEWILKLEHGRYERYSNQLSTGFNDERVDGKNIKDVNEQDLRNYGVNLLSDRKDLLKSIQNIVNSEMYKPQLEGQNQA